MQEISSTPIKLHKSLPLNVNTRQVSLLANSTLGNLKGVVSKANTFVSSEKRNVEYRMRDVEVFKGEDKLNLAAFYCHSKGGKLVEVHSPEDKQYIAKVMSKLNLPKIPLDLIAARGTFYYPDGSYYDFLTPAQASDLQALQANYVFFDNQGKITKAVAGDLAAEIPILCQRPLSTLRQNNGSSKAVIKLVHNMVGKLLEGIELVQMFRDLPNLPSGSLTAMAGKVLDLVPGGRLMELFQLSKRINTKAFWKDLRITDLGRLDKLIDWVKGLKTGPGTTAKLPLIKGDQIQDFFNQDQNTNISDVVFTPLMKSSAPSDFLLAGKASFLEYSKSDLLRISTFSSFVHDGEMIPTSFLVEHQEVSYTTDKPPILGQCGKDPCPTILDFTFEQASCAKYILGHALATSKHCQKIPVDFPVCYRTTCDDSGNMVCSTGEVAYLDAICRDKMTQVVRLPVGTHYSRTDCRLTYKGTTILDEIEDGNYFVPPKFEETGPAVSALKDFLLYSLAFLFVSVLCCVVSGYTFTRPAVQHCVGEILQCGGSCCSRPQVTAPHHHSEAEGLNQPQASGQPDTVSHKSVDQESRSASRLGLNASITRPNSAADLGP